MDEHTARRGIRAKLRRAFDHTYQFEQEVRVFHDQETSAIVLVLENNGKELVGYLRELVPIPDHWAVLLGEIAYNLRSALDQSVYQISLANGTQRPERTFFPIFDNVADFRRTGRQGIASLPQETRALIEHLQPFELDSVAQRNLLFLNRLSNRDKHRLIELCGYAPLTEIALSPPANKIVWNNNVLHDGAEAVRLFYAEPITRDQVQMGERTTVSISVQGPDGTGGFALADLCDCVGALVHVLLTYAAHPGRAVIPASRTDSTVKG